MITLIAAGSYNDKTGQLGIGYKGGIPWKIPEDLAHFKLATKGQVVVMGRKTFESIGSVPLPNRINLVLSNTMSNNTSSNDNLMFLNLNGVLDKIAYYNFCNYKIYIIGGEEVYKYFLSCCQKIILSSIHKSYECDTFFPEIPVYFDIVSHTKYTDFTVIEYNRNQGIICENENVDICYKKLIHTVLLAGNSRPDRTGTGTISVFGQQLKLDISNHCPLLTTKKVAWKTCIKELLWFLRGETDAKILQKQNVHIWDGNTSREFLDKRGLIDYPEGELGPGYGWQIRRSGAKFPDPSGGVDQLEQIESLLKNDPFSRRIMWNLYVPQDLDKMSLVPCFPAGTHVLTNNGYKNIENVLISDLLLTHKGNWRQINNLQTKTYNDEMYELHLGSNTKKIKCTKEHPFYVKDSIKKTNKTIIGYSEGYWVNAENLDKSKHNLCLPINKNSIIPEFTITKGVNKTKSEIVIKKIEEYNEWFMIGYFMGDGWIDLKEGQNKFTFAINKQCLEVVDILSSFLHLTYKDETDKLIRYICSNKVWWTILKELGHLAHNKKIPEWIQDAPKKCIQAFIDGYTKADGCKTNESFIIYTTVSEHIAYGLQRLYAKLGIILSVTYQIRPATTVIEGRTVNQRNTYSMKTLQGLRKYAPCIDEDYMYFPIKSINKQIENTTVYNFEVDEDNSYIVQNVAVHNCHFALQMYVTQKKDGMYLSGLVNMRSNDLFLGNPFNIFSYYVLIRLLAIRHNMKPDTLILNIGDLHIYSNHIDAVNEQLLRPFRASPILNINNDIKNKAWEDITIDDFDLIGYFPHPNIKAKMAV